VTLAEFSRYPFLFQYPLTDRGGCNEAVTELNARLLEFQYPLTDRGGCNYALSDAEYREQVHFSIH